MGKFMVGVARCLSLCVVMLVLPALAAAFPIAAPGTEGLEVVVSSTGPVIATYQGQNLATFSNDLYLVVDGNPANDRFLFNNHASPVGSQVNLGSFPVGTILIFRLHVRNTGIDYYTGPGSRNPDGKPHARAQADWLPNETLVSFEDYVDFAYNDLSFSFVPTTAVNPLPDLIPTKIEYNAAELVPGGTVTFDSGIQNAGAQGTEVFNVQWFVDGVLVGYGGHGGVPANSTVLDGNSAYRWPATAGTHTIEFRVDVNNHVAEANEGNNSASITVTVAATQVQITDKPEGKAPNLIVLVHGCCTNANDVTKDWDSFANLIKDAIRVNLDL